MQIIIKEVALDMMEAEDSDKEVTEMPDLLNSFESREELEDYLENVVPPENWFAPPSPPFDLIGKSSYGL